MESVQVQIHTQDVANENVVNRKAVPSDVDDNDEARISLADEVFVEVGLGMLDSGTGNLP